MLGCRQAQAVLLGKSGLYSRDSADYAVKPVEWAWTFAQRFPKRAETEQDWNCQWRERLEKFFHEIPKTGWRVLEGA